MGLAVFILFVEYMFMTVYEDNLRQNIGDNIEKLALSDPTIGWKHWFTMIFPAAVLAVFAAYYEQLDDLFAVLSEETEEGDPHASRLFDHLTGRAQRRQSAAGEV